MADFEMRGSEEARFNMGIATLERIHRLLISAHECSLGVSDLAQHHTVEQVRLQLLTLDRIYVELKPNLLKPEQSAIEKLRGGINKLFSKSNREDWVKIQPTLFDYELLMRSSGYMKKMLMPRTDEAERALR